MLKNLELAAVLAVPSSCWKPDALAPRVSYSTVPRGRPKVGIKVAGIICDARRRVLYEDNDESGDDQYGHNEQISMLETYTQSARNEVLLVQGFSSSLSCGTSPDPSRSILPSRAVIKTIQWIKGPFDPSNLEYIEKDLTWQDFKDPFSPQHENLALLCSVFCSLYFVYPPLCKLDDVLSPCDCNLQPGPDHNGHDTQFFA